MKQYVIDELQPEDSEKIEEYVKHHFSATGLDQIYWVMLPGDLLNDIQKSHRECRPFYVAVELMDTSVKCELLVRSKMRLGCDCIRYADHQQRNWVIDQMDLMIGNLGIRT